MLRSLLVTRGFGNGTLVGSINDLVIRGYTVGFILEFILENLAIVAQDQEVEALVYRITEFQRSLVAVDYDLTSTIARDFNELIESVLAIDFDGLEALPAEDLENISKVIEGLEVYSTLLGLREERIVDVTEDKENTDTDVSTDIDEQAILAKTQERNTKT